MLIYLQTIENYDDRYKFEQLYTKYRALMFHAARRILSNPADLEDAVHQAFTSVLENIDKISEVNSPKTASYLVIITERKAIDIYRSYARTPGVALDETKLGIRIDTIEEHPLADALARLPASYRGVILLRYYHGYSVREIASILGIKKDAAQKSLYRAKIALKKQLGGADNE